MHFRFMSLTVLATILSLSFGFAKDAGAQPSPPPPSATFTVTFDGLVVHDLYDKHPKRALVVQGNAKSMRHVPLLITDTDIDENALSDSTGQPVFCGVMQGDTKETCRVLIDGFDMQIVGADGSVLTPVLTIDSTFDDLTPHLQKVTKGTIRDSVASDLPGPPIAGFFELTGGTLTACAFARPAFFDKDHDFDHEGNRYFAEIVTLTGSIKSQSKAVLQIRSNATLGEWVPVPHSKDAPLAIRIDNHAPRHNGKLMATPRHWALIRKVLILPADGFPAVCPAPYDVNDDDEPACSKGPSVFMQQNVNLCIGDAPVVSLDALLKSRMTAMRSKTLETLSGQRTGEPSLELLPGCANSTYP